MINDIPRRYGVSACYSAAVCIHHVTESKFKEQLNIKGDETRRDIKPLLESVQLRKHCISKAERHRARRYGLFGFAWFENIVFGRFAKCACQPPRGFHVNGK